MFSTPKKKHPNKSLALVRLRSLWRISLTCLILTSLCGCFANSSTNGGSEFSPTLISAKDFTQAPQRYLKERNLIIFFASWCMECRLEMPSLARLAEQFADSESTVIGVAVYDRETELRRFLSDTRASFPVVYDPEGELAATYGFGRVPYAIALDRSGARVPLKDPSTNRLVDQVVGGRDWLSPPFIEWMNEKMKIKTGGSSSHP